jgi:CRISPR/Cas system CSM-associated protein Csm3 (group 7 of RAMP superfamily)
MTTTTERLTADGAGTARTRSVSLFSFTLRFTEPGGVTVPGKADRGAAAERDRAHALLDSGPRGVHLPGPSLAGALRAMVTGKWPSRADDLFGFLLPAGTSADDVDAVPSRIRVLGSRRLDDGSEFRSSTKVSRRRAAAEANTLRTEEVLPAGARFEVFLRWDGPSEAEAAEFAALLCAWRPLIGRGVSRGRGACVTENVRYGALDLDNPADLLRWLTLNGPDLVDAVAGAPLPATSTAEPEPVLRVTAEISGPFRIGYGHKPPAGSREPVRLLRGGDGEPLVPGAGVKGLLRSRAEFILRSVGIRACDDQRCGRGAPCWTCQVFGRGGGRDESAESVGARALLRIPDTAVRDFAERSRTHVAIDRFTGGARPEALYSMELLEAGHFELRVDPIAEISEPLLEEIRAVLRLVLDDIADGIIGLGAGVARGYGTIRLSGLETSGLPGTAQAQEVLAKMAGLNEQ